MLQGRCCCKLSSASPYILGFVFTAYADYNKPYFPIKKRVAPEVLDTVAGARDAIVEEYGPLSEDELSTSFTPTIKRPKGFQMLSSTDDSSASPSNSPTKLLLPSKSSGAVKSEVSSSTVAATSAASLKKPSKKAKKGTKSKD
jgi:hypothetical protein